MKALRVSEQTVGSSSQSECSEWRETEREEKSETETFHIFNVARSSGADDMSHILFGPCQGKCVNRR